MSRPRNPAPTTRGKDTALHFALVPLGSKAFPTAEVFTVGATPAAKGATSITLAGATTNPLIDGQGLLFVDANDFQFIAAVDGDHAAGVTDITVRALGEEIPAAATASFPVRSALRQAANISKSAENTEIDTFDHEASEYLVTRNTAELSADGLYGLKDAGRETLEAAYEQKIPVYFSVTYAPDSAQYTRGEREEGFAIITSLGKDSPNEDQNSFNASLSVSGKLTRTDPIPVA